MTEILRVSVRDVLRQFSHISDQCLKSPVIVTKNGRDRLVIMDFDEYRMLLDTLDELRPDANAAALKLRIASDQPLKATRR